MVVLCRMTFETTTGHVDRQMMEFTASQKIDVTFVIADGSDQNVECLASMAIFMVCSDGRGYCWLWLEGNGHCSHVLLR